MRLYVVVMVTCFFMTRAGALASDSKPVVSDLSPQYVVERLKEMRQGWKAVEIEYAQFEKRPASDPPGAEARITRRGRFVLTPPNCGEWEIFAVDRNGRKREEEPCDRFVWTADEFQIHSPDGHIERISLSELRERSGRLWPNVEAKESIAKEPDEQEQTFLQWFLSSILSSILSNGEWYPLIVQASPKNCLPLAFAVDTKTLEDRFELTVKETDKHVFLLAHPRRLDDQRNFRETSICIDSETFIPIAKRVALPNGDYFSYVVTSLRVNGEDITAPLSREERQAP